MPTFSDELIAMNNHNPQQLTNHLYGGFFAILIKTKKTWKRERY